MDGLAKHRMSDDGRQHLQQLSSLRSNQQMIKLLEMLKKRDSHLSERAIENYLFVLSELKKKLQQPQRLQASSCPRKAKQERDSKPKQAGKALKCSSLWWLLFFLL